MLRANKENKNSHYLISRKCESSHTINNGNNFSRNLFPPEGSFEIYSCIKLAINLNNNKNFVTQQKASFMRLALVLLAKISSMYEEDSVT